MNDWLGDASTRFPLSFPHITYSRAPDKPSKGGMRSKASSVSTRLSEFATESNRLRNKHAHRKYSNSFLGVKQTTHSRESYVSTCNEVCPRKILPPHFFTAHFTKAPPPPPPRKQECQHYFFHLPYRLYEFKRTLKWAKLAEIKLSDCLQRKHSWP